VRRRNAEELILALKELPFVCFPNQVPKADPIYLRLPVLINGNVSREALFQRLHQNGIGVSRMYERSLSEIFANNLVQDGKKYPAAEYIAHHLLTLPTHHLIRNQDLHKIIETFYEGGAQ
jgi:dTDP-4-amino-4,6-dideoxygalactose transaminase